MIRQFVAAFVLSGLAKIARISLLPQALPFAIVAGADGNIWFVDSFTDETGRVTI